MKLDHIIVAVSDLDAAASTYERILGRPVAVRSEHPRGTRNALFLFERGPYLELLALRPSDERGSSAAALAAFLDQRGEGLFGFALSPADMEAAVTRLRDVGLDINDAVANSGTDVAGRVREWRGTAVPSTAGEVSFLVEHLGSDWRTERRPPPEPSRGRTAVASIHHIAFDVPHPSDASAAWDERFGLPQTDAVVSERMGARVNIHAAGEATVELVGATRKDGPVAARIARRGHGLAGLAFEVHDLDGALTAVRAAGITAGDPEIGVLPDSRVVRIDPGSAHGVAAQLVQFDDRGER